MVVKSPEQSNDFFSNDREEKANNQLDFPKHNAYNIRRQQLKGDNQLD